MTYGWFFNQARPGDRARESQVDKFFKSDAVQNPANAVVREGTQNTLDAVTAGGTAKVRIGLHTVTDPGCGGKYFAGLFEHIDPLRANHKLVDAPFPNEGCGFLTFEDFGTSGLGGDPGQWWPKEGVSNPFFNFFRGEGITDKEGGNRGRHGVGKFVFAAASRARAIFGLTIRADGRRLLMGTTVLKLHSIAGEHFMPDGWFGARGENDLVIPVESDSLVDDFATDFRLARTNQTGLSVVVPFLDPSVTADAVIEAVVRGYFYPILRGELVIELATDNWPQPLVIDAQTIQTVMGARPELAASMKPLLDLAIWSLANANPPALLPPAGGAPKWESALIPDGTKKDLQKLMADGDRMSFRASANVRPKAGQGQVSHFEAYFIRDPACDEGQIAFIREGIIVSNVRPRRCGGIRGIVLIDDEPLATFLGDAENPSHTDWQKDSVKDKYFLAPSLLSYVIESIPSVIRILGDEDEKTRRPLWGDLFSLPIEAAEGAKGKKKKPKVEPGDEKPIVPPIPPGKAKRYRVDKTDGGFILRRGAPEAAMPPIIEVSAAYGVRKGSPFGRYSTEDFVFGKKPIDVVTSGAEQVEAKENVLTLRITDPDFEVFITGFDPNRDLEIRPIVKEAEDGHQA